MQAWQPHVELTGPGGRRAADIAKVPLATARLLADLGRQGRFNAH